MFMTKIMAALAVDQAITAIVGNGIYAVAIPQKHTRPCIVLAISGNFPLDVNDTPSPVDTVSIELWCEARSYAEVEDLCYKVRKCLEAIRRDEIQRVRYLTENDQEYNTDLRLFARLMSFTVRVAKT